VYGRISEEYNLIESVEGNSVGITRSAVMRKRRSANLDSDGMSPQIGAQ